LGAPADIENKQAYSSTTGNEVEFRLAVENTLNQGFPQQKSASALRTQICKLRINCVF